LQGQEKVTKVAAVHASSVFMNVEGSTDKACELIREASRNGAQLVAFPETFLPGYPYWVWDVSPSEGIGLFPHLFNNSVVVGSDITDRIAMTAASTSIQVIIGISERDGGSLFNTLLHFDETGQLLSRRRKLQPTGAEKLVWGCGDAAQLHVADTRIGKIGSLICFEHMMDLARFTLVAEHEEIHISVWPAISAMTANPGSQGFNHFTDAAVRHHAFSGQCFVINVQACVDESTLEWLGHSPEKARPGGGKSSIIGPDGRYIAGPHEDTETILYADLDLQEIVFAKHICDPAGHYARSDIFRLVVDDQPKPIKVGLHASKISNGAREAQEDPRDQTDERNSPSTISSRAGGC
jgi:nitrilase